MGGGFTYMTAERIQQTKAELLEQWAQLKQARQALEGRFSIWGYVFRTASGVMENPGQHEQINFDKFPDKAELQTALDEYRKTNGEIHRTETALDGMGIKLH